MTFSVMTLSIECHYAECCCAECRDYLNVMYAECLYTECHYAECRSAASVNIIVRQMQAILYYLKFTLHLSSELGLIVSAFMMSI